MPTLSGKQILVDGVVGFFPYIMNTNQDFNMVGNPITKLLGLHLHIILNFWGYTDNYRFLI